MYRAVLQLPTYAANSALRGEIGASSCYARIVAQGPVKAVSHAVRFDVGFVDDIEAVFVTQGIPARIVGVMGGSHRVKVVLLHQLNIA